jgi:hypothetical protein
MKKLHSILLIFIVLWIPALIRAQEPEAQTGDTTYYKTLIPESKQTLLKNMSMIANMRFTFRNEFTDGEYSQSRFTMEQFRLEFRGMVSKHVYFRWRNRFTRTPEVQSIDNIVRSIDLMYIRVDATPKLSIYAGKMCADWGGFEFDYNPIDIYEYSDIIEQADNFLTGVGVSYQLNKRHQLTLQTLDSRTATFQELYGTQPGITVSKFPLAIIGNWRGSFFHGKFNTIWSYAIHTEAKDVFMNYIALGNQLKLGKFTAEYDFKWSDEDLDRTGLISGFIPDSLYPYAVKNTQYISNWLHVYYRLNQKFNFAFVVFLDNAKWKNNIDPQKTTDEIRTAWGYIPTIEYYPWKDLNLRFYVNWVGRVYNYSSYAKERFGMKDLTMGRFCIGFVSPLGIF